MDQALDPVFDLDEGAEANDARHDTFENVAELNPGVERGPRVGTEFFEAERDPPEVGIGRQDDGLDLLSQAEDIGRVPDATPGNLGNVDQAFYAAQIEEGSERRKIRNDPDDFLAGLETAQELEASSRRRLGGPLRKDQPTALGIELDHSQAQRPAAEGAPLRGVQQ